MAWVPLGMALALASWITWKSGMRRETRREAWFSLIAGVLVGWMAVHVLDAVREALP